MRQLWPIFLVAAACNTFADVETVLVDDVGTTLDAGTDARIENDLSDDSDTSTTCASACSDGETCVEGVCLRLCDNVLCDGNAVCEDLECQCLAGFSGDGRVCVRSPEIHYYDSSMITGTVATHAGITLVVVRVNEDWSRDYVVTLGGETVGTYLPTSAESSLIVGVLETDQALPLEVRLEGASADLWLISFPGLLGATVLDATVERDRVLTYDYMLDRPEFLELVSWGRPGGFSPGAGDVVVLDSVKGFAAVLHVPGRASTVGGSFGAPTDYISFPIALEFP